ncbi:MAG: SH3 domain-containing protein [Clostridia bacterium]
MYQDDCFKSQECNDEFDDVNAPEITDIANSDNDVRIGKVVDCERLNVREQPFADAEIICEIAEATEIMIEENDSTGEFYKICTSSGIEGFCMKRYISILE